MDEFVSRMATQRHVLEVVNSKTQFQESLFGLSADAINRWATVNRLGATSHVVTLLTKISSELFFIATRSQEPVSDEYESRKESIVVTVSELEESLNLAPKAGI